MDRDDYICRYFENVNILRYPEADVFVNRCERTGKQFDEFHSPCKNCKYDTSK